MSQGSIYKILAGIGYPQVHTYQKLASAFPDKWANYLRRHPSFRRELGRTFGWAALSKPSTVSEEREFIEFLESYLGLDQLSLLPLEYRERYRERVREILQGVAQQLEEYREALEGEFRGSGSKGVTPRRKKSL